MKDWIEMGNSKGEKYKVSTKSEKDRELYYLFRFENGNWKQVSKSKNPKSFDDIVFKDRIDFDDEE